MFASKFFGKSKGLHTLLVWALTQGAQVLRAGSIRRGLEDKSRTSTCGHECTVPLGNERLACDYGEGIMKGSPHPSCLSHLHLPGS